MKLILFVLASLALSAVASADLKKIQGTWKPSTGQIGSKALPKSMLDKMVLIIKDGTYDYDEGHGHDIGTLKEIAGKTPQEMDIIGTKGPNKGHTYLTIYKLEGSALIICYGLDGHRPKSFTDNGKAVTMLIKYHRAG